MTGADGERVTAPAADEVDTDLVLRATYANDKANKLAPMYVGSHASAMRNERYFGPLTRLAWYFRGVVLEDYEEPEVVAAEAE